MLIYICLIICLLIIIKEDVEDRSISVWVLISLFLITILNGIFEIGWYSFSILFFINLSFVFVQLFFITAYFSLREGKLTNIVDRFLGLGDILFFIPMAGLFSPLYFAVVYLSSLIFVLVGFLIYSSVIDTSIKTIPLAGGQSFFLLIVLFLSWLKQIDLYANTLLISFL